MRRDARQGLNGAASNLKCNTSWRKVFTSKNRPRLHRCSSRPRPRSRRSQPTAPDLRDQRRAQPRHRGSDSATSRFDGAARSGAGRLAPRRPYAHRGGTR